MTLKPDLMKGKLTLKLITTSFNRVNQELISTEPAQNLASIYCKEPKPLPDPALNQPGLLKKKQRRLLQLGLYALAVLLLAFLNLNQALAQTNGDPIGKFKAGADKITKGIQQISGPALVLLLFLGGGTLMWGGLSENIRARALRIIFFSIVGAGLVFLFAQPLGDFLNSSFTSS